MFRKISILLISAMPMMASASDFDDILDTVVNNNLSIKYTDVDNAATIGEMKAENSLDAPEVSVEKLWGSKEAGSKFSLSVEQSFDWPGVYAARREAINKSETAMQYLRESEVLSVRMDVRLALIDLINIRQRIASTVKICDGMGKMVEYFKEAVEKGLETRLDYNKAVIEHINAVRELKSLRSEESVLLSSLQALNGGKPVDALVEKLGDRYPRANLESLRPTRKKLREKDPAMLASQASVDAQKSLVKVERRSLLPGFSLGYVYEREEGESFNGFSVSLSLPFLTQRKKTKAALMRLEAQSFEQELALIKLQSEMEGEYQTARNYEELLKEYRGVMEDDSNFELLKKAFDTGQINFLTYMQEMNYFLEARREFLDIHYRYHLALARLQRYE